MFDDDFWIFYYRFLEFSINKFNTGKEKGSKDKRKNKE